MAEYPVRKSLPVSYSREIGRAITHWAYLEWRLKNVAYALVDVGPQEGRLAVRDPRGSDYITMFEDLLHIKKLSVPTDLTRFRKYLVKLKDHRDELAHGIWLKHPSHKLPALQLTKRTWDPNLGAPKHMAGRKRVIEPEGVIITVQGLQQFVRLIDNAAKIAGHLEAEVRAALASLPQKPTEQ